MTELLRPGVFISEVGSTPVITGVSTSIAGIVGTAQKGPNDRPVLVTSFTQFVDKFGGYSSPNTSLFDLYLAAKGFFENGGKFLYVQRVVGSGATRSSLTVEPLGDFSSTAAGDAYVFNAKWLGSWANNVAVSTIKASTTVHSSVNIVNDLTAGIDDITTIPVNSTVGFEIGDVVKITDPAFTELEVIIDIDSTTNPQTITVGRLSTIPASTSVTAGIPVETCTTHRAQTFITSAISDMTGAVSSCVVDSSANLRVGDDFFIIDKDGNNSRGNILEGKITSINGNTINFLKIHVESPSSATSSELSVGSLFIVNDFSVNVYSNGDVVESHKNLSFNQESEYYITDVLPDPTTDAGKDNVTSNYIYVTILGGDSVLALGDLATNYNARFETFLVPLTIGATLLTNGTDGGAVTDTEYTDGINKFSGVDEISMLAVPNAGATANVAGIKFAETRGDLIYLCEPTSTDVTPELALNYRNYTLGSDSSYGALYWPFIKVADPRSSNALVEISSLGHIMGIYASVSAENGVHFPPANRQIVGAVDVAYNTSDSEHELLNPVGVNVIRIIGGRGVRVYGARTLQKPQDGRHYVNVRRFLNFYKESIEDVISNYVFYPNNKTLWDTLQTSISSFTESLWSQGMLFPSDSMEKAFYVKCDEETNPPSSVAQGIVVIEIGITPVRPAEFILLRIQVLDGTVTVSEA